MGSCTCEEPRLRMEVRVPATTANLGPGFDCLGMALDLHITTIVELRDAGLTIAVEGEGSDTLPRDETNLVVRSASLVFKNLGRPRPGLALSVDNRIPVGRGLGSSAAAVVAGLLAGNVLAGGALSTADLLGLAHHLEGHLDNCAAALLGGVVVVAAPAGDGGTGKPCWTRLPCPPGLTVVAAVPDFPLSTVASRRVLPVQIPLADAVFNVGRAALWVAAMAAGRPALLREAMRDRLHQPYRRRLVPGLDRALEAGIAAGAWGTALSGAGPTVIALADAEHARAVGAALRRAFGREGVKARILTLRPDDGGARARIISGGGTNSC